MASHILGENMSNLGSGKQACQVFLFREWQDCFFEVQQSGPIVLTFVNGEKEIKLSLENYHVHKVEDLNYPISLRRYVFNCNPLTTIVVESHRDEVVEFHPIRFTKE